MSGAPATSPAHPGTAATPRWVLFLTFLRLGLTSFGGPIAHLGYYRAEFVERRRWLDEAAFTNLVALCQFLPGPSSTQLGFAVGLSRGGLVGGVLAWIGFTAPSAVALVAFALGVAGAAQGSGWLQGLKIVAVAVVAQAVWTMARRLCPDAKRATLAVAAAIAVLVAPGVATQIGVLVGGAVVGLAVLRRLAETDASTALAVPIGRATALAALATFAALLVGLPLLASVGAGGPGAVGPGSDALALADAFYRAGALVFGGGHVVLPLLQAEVVPPGWVTPDAFVAGYGAAQAVPGPLFTFAAYLGATAAVDVPVVPAALIALVAIFLPGLLLVVGVLPFWGWLTARRGARSALLGVNAAVVGILGAAFYDPIWTGTIGGVADLALALIAFVLLQMWKLPVWSVVILTAAGGALAAAF